MNRLLLRYILLLLSFLLIPEAYFTYRYGGPPPLEGDPYNFQEQYVYINDRFFEKIRKKSGKAYVPRRPNNHSIEFSEKKGSNILRIFIIGGSVAYVFSHFNFSNTLSAADPSRKYEIINCGMGAYDTFREMLIEKEILSYAPDLIVLFSGNNEFYNPPKINVGVYRTNKLLRRLWVYRIAQARLNKFFPSRRITRDTRKKFFDYGENIRLMVQRAKAAHVPVILCTLPDNFKDCAPLGQPPLDKRYIIGHFLLTNSDYIEAIPFFQDYLKTYPDNTFGLYFLGRAFEGLKNYDSAGQMYRKSLNADFGHNRASFESNALLRKIAGEYNSGVADIESAFLAVAPYGLLGREQFVDNCHWYSEYNSIVADELVKSMLRIGCIKSVASNNMFSAVFSGNVPLRQRGKDEKQLRRSIRGVLGEIFRYPNDAISERAISYLETLYYMDPLLMEDINALKQKMSQESLADGRLRYLISDFERDWPRVLYHIGELFRRLQQYGRALIYYDEAILNNADNEFPYVGRALCHYALKDYKTALADLSGVEKKRHSVLVDYCKEFIILKQKGML